MGNEETTMIKNPRVVKAFYAMRHLGIPDEKTKLHLKKLLILYDKNWELIEEENYRALADAILDQDDTSKESLDKESPLLCIKSEVNNSSSSINTLKFVKHDNVEPNFSTATMSLPVLIKEKQHSVMHECTCDRIVLNQRKTRSQTMSTLCKDIEKPSCTYCKNKKSLSVGTKGVEIRGEESVSKPIEKVNDISKGHEEVPITLVNEVNDECPPSFKYISKNVIFNKAYVNFSMARIADDDNSCATCQGNCVSSYPPCGCARETRGDFAYTVDGLVKEDFLNDCVSMNHSPEKHNLFYCEEECPLEKLKNEENSEDHKCKGHLVRKFIKECWWKCGCHRECGNRIVQRGININLQVFMTPEVGKGWGVRTLQDLPKGSFVCEYVGEILTNAELYERVLKKDDKVHTYPVLLDADWGSEGVLKDEEALCLDATHYGNVARFINHRCFDCNLVEIPVEVETPDHHYYHLAFFTLREVKALEELTWDYGIDFDDHEHPVKAFRCRCGSKFCRNNKPNTRKKKLKTAR